MPTEDIPIPTEVAPVMQELACGMDLKKCRQCGCMQDALSQAEGAFGSAEESNIRVLLPLIRDYKARMAPIAYDCIGCKKCFGADATIQLINRFDGVEADSCGSGSPQSPADAPVMRVTNLAERAWPIYPGNYVVGASSGSVAVCTLSSRDLASVIVERGCPDVAVAGRCDTENIGVEKVVLNLISNPQIRWLILCGIEAQGHRTGDAFLRLKERGVDANMRVLESASWRPVLKNLTLVDVARFREQVEVINLIGTTDIDTIVQAVKDCATRPLALLAESTKTSESLTVERITARTPKQLKLDRAGFFIVLPQPETGLIVCEHYENNGRLAHVIEGRIAAAIAATVVERGLITLLDHAAYLGRELAKAELSLKTGVVYEQDAALENLMPAASTVAAVTTEVCGSTKTWGSTNDSAKVSACC